ncbi:MAG: hypothetical protein SV062_08115 [Thermodesulfobacteriota bacterium]|nr:hypothetical protein [Thermodesulfobacteriota bacterium]
MEYKTEENDEKFMILTKEEFEKNYFVGCLYDYESNGEPDSVVKIKVYGIVPDMKHCVLNVRWHVDYDNAVGRNDEGFWKWWTVTDRQNNEKYFKCNTEDDANWLCDILNKVAT